MYTSDMQLQERGLKPMAWLPNRDGFKFIGMMRTGHPRDCYVKRGADGNHTIVGCEFGDLVGWKDRPSA